MNNKTSNNKVISIGGLAAGSGVPVETIRNWETRYGFPRPTRLNSGHRRYEMAIIERLKKIKVLVDMGYKPSLAVNLDGNELNSLMLSGGVTAVSASSNQESEDSPAVIQRWLTFTEEMNVAELSRALTKEWNRIGAKGFIFELALPFLKQVGIKWKNAEFSVAHEHFASDVFQTFLASQWRPLIGTHHRKKLLLANQEGDLHSLGLQMAAVLASLQNIEPVFLGSNTPLQDIIIASAEKKVNAVVIGLSSVSNPEHSQHFLQALKRGLFGVRLAFGGNNHLPVLSDIEYIETLEDFDKWCRHI